MLLDSDKRRSYLRVIGGVSYYRHFPLERQDKFLNHSFPDWYFVSPLTPRYKHEPVNQEDVDF